MDINQFACAGLAWLVLPAPAPEPLGARFWRRRQVRRLCRRPAAIAPAVPHSRRRRLRDGGGRAGRPPTGQMESFRSPPRL